MDEEIERLLKPADVAAILGVSRTQAYRLMGRELPAVRFGNTVRVRRADLEKFIESHTTNNGKTRPR
ncbi:MAG: DNA-binding protein [Candidatus Omnitrophota bacterium]|jgi:excisionase family DNA binding protein|nr:MAG: DNA-binding protein [Candidatus Omnitrophota bacterium]